MVMMVVLMKRAIFVVIGFRVLLIKRSFFLILSMVAGAVVGGRTTMAGLGVLVTCHNHLLALVAA
jgi:hypothetical protein